MIFALITFKSYFIFFKRIFRVYKVSTSCCCSIFNERFACLLEEFSLSSRRQLCYYITSSRVCQEVFENFLKFFSRFLRYRSVEIASRLTTRLLYHINLPLSIPFFKFLQIFSSFSSSHQKNTAEAATTADSDGISVISCRWDKPSR